MKTVFADPNSEALRFLRGCLDAHNKGPITLAGKLSPMLVGTSTEPPKFVCDVFGEKVITYLYEDDLQRMYKEYEDTGNTLPFYTLIRSFENSVFNACREGIIKILKGKSYIEKALDDDIRIEYSFKVEECIVIDEITNIGTYLIINIEDRLYALFFSKGYIDLSSPHLKDDKVFLYGEDTVNILEQFFLEKL